MHTGKDCEETESKDYVGVVAVGGGEGGGVVSAAHIRHALNIARAHGISTEYSAGAHDGRMGK